MRDSLRQRCPRCAEMVPVDLDTDGHGHLVERLAAHRCVPRARPADDAEPLRRLCRTCEKPLRPRCRADLHYHTTGDCHPGLARMARRLAGHLNGGPHDV